MHNLSTLEEWKEWTASAQTKEFVSELKELKKGLLDNFMKKGIDIEENRGRIRQLEEVINYMEIKKGED